MAALVAVDYLIGTVVGHWQYVIAVAIGLILLTWIVAVIVDMVTFSTGVQRPPRPPRRRRSADGRPAGQPTIWMEVARSAQGRPPRPGWRR